MKIDRIKKLKDANGNWVANAETSEQLVSDFFKVMYTKAPDVKRLVKRIG